MKRFAKVLIMMVALTPFLMAGTCSDKDDNGSLVLLASLYTLIQAQAFKGSCRTETGQCTNFFASAISGCQDTSSTSKCSTSSSIGACKIGTNKEQVWYTGGTHGSYASCADDSTCASICGTLSGTWANDYTGQ